MTHDLAVAQGTVQAGRESAPGAGALDVHSHAMPLPLLQILADRGLANLDAVPDGIVRLDPRVSGSVPRRGQSICAAE